MVKDGPGQEENSKEEEEDSPTKEDFKEGSLTKVPPQRDPKYLQSQRQGQRPLLPLPPARTLCSQMPQEK